MREHAVQQMPANRRNDGLGYVSTDQHVLCGYHLAAVGIDIQLSKESHFDPKLGQSLL